MRRRPNRINRPVAGHVEKSLPAMLAATGNGQIRTSDVVLSMQRQQGGVPGGLVEPLPRAMWDAPFGPGIPLVPAAIDPLRSDSGRPEPRISEYPIAWNIPGTRGRLVPWRVLREAAELPIISDCIRVRKEECATLDWEIGVSRRAVAAAARANPGTSRRSAEADLRKRLLPEIDRLREFWEEPDKINGLHFPAWISQLLDERLVLDAVSIWPRRSLGGDMLGLVLLDGSTIKPLLDEWGGRPQAPQPAFQQVLYGFPRGEFTADSVETDRGTVIPGAFSADQLIYEVRDRRTWTPYGRSPVEAALLDLDTWMKRVDWLRSEYTDGVMPSGWLINRGSAGAAEWTPQQVLEYEVALNDLYSGDTAQRRRYRVLPPGIEPDMSPEVGEKFRPDYDLHLLKLLVAHFDITITELGFTETQGLGSAGHSEAQAELNERKGSVPTLRALQAMLTRISRRHLDMPEELEWRWTQLASDDDEADQTVAEQVAAGLLTFNEGRDQLGRPRYAFPEGDMAAIVSARTGALTFIDGSSLPPEPEPGADGANPGAGGPPGAGQDAAVTAKPAPRADSHAGGAPNGAQPADEASTGTKSADMAAEAAAYRRWAAKSRGGRRFELQHIVMPDDLERFQIDPGRVTFLPKAGGGGPKADEPAWAGWDVDERTAQAWAQRLRSALTDALPLHTLAGDWLHTQANHPRRERRDRRDEGPDTGLLALVSAALAFLAPSTAALAARLGAVCEQAAVDGWWIGQQAAHAARGEPVDWADWEPGQVGNPRALIEHPEALRRFIAGLGTADMVQTRIERLARVMARAVDEDWSADQLAKAMRDVLDDEHAATVTAQTIVTAAGGAAALAVYRAAELLQVRWLTEADARVCPTCDANGAAGPVDLGDPFPSGDPAPPAHPRCRCAVVPA